MAYQDARRALVDELGIEPSIALQELERAILRQDASLEVEAPAAARVREAVERSGPVAITRDSRIDELLALTEPLVRSPPRAVILASLVPDAGDLRSASAWLEEHRSAFEARAVVARPASFTSTAPARIARLAAELDVDLVLAKFPTSSWTKELPTGSLLPFLPRRPATWHCSLLGTPRLEARSSCRSEEPITTGLPSSSAPGWLEPNASLFGSQGPPLCPSAGDATRAACSPTARRRPARSRHLGRGAPDAAG